MCWHAYLMVPVHIGVELGSSVYHEDSGPQGWCQELLLLSYLTSPFENKFQGKTNSLSCVTSLTFCSLPSREEHQS